MEQTCLFNDAVFSRYQHEQKARGLKANLSIDLCVQIERIAIARVNHVRLLNDDVHGGMGTSMF